MIDKRLLVDTVAVKLELEKDEWGSPVLGGPISLSNVRFDRSIKNDGSQNNRTQSKIGVIYVYPQYCPVTIDKSWMNALVEDEFGTYLIRDIIINRNPFNNKVFSYEIEVI
ncbi:putative minor capsid protein [Eremococcus coleocola]|uniref:putative minor capsid protein n=1 Tax=Eremococcus coleocola TaxID=88132 RepID=UPI00047F4389|nr:putative minor capsid protein [Eremococcus coleocola]